MFFSKQQHFIPILHPGRYLRAWYSPPHMRPPMCLQYAIWAMASSGHEKYNEYADVFYQRARNYANADEMKVWAIDVPRWRMSHGLERPKC